MAKNSVGIDNPTLSLQIKQAILQIELYSEQIEEVEKLSKQILDEMKSKLLTIPGISYNQATAIHGFIGEIIFIRKGAVCHRCKRCGAVN